MRVGSLPRGSLPPSCGAGVTPLVSVSPKLTWCPEPYLKSRKAEKAAATRNSDFGDVREIRRQSWGRDGGRCVLGSSVIWFGHGVRS
jgi:hypothetical protein